MKFGVREICDVVLKAKATTKIGNKIFYKNEPVIYFDSLKTSSMEGAATTVYAQGGRGNSRLAAWEGERTVTFTMEDALISPEGFMILSGAGLIEPTANRSIYQHIIETTDSFSLGEDGQSVTVLIDKNPHLPADKKDNYAYVMFMLNGNTISEPFIPVHGETVEKDEETGKYKLVIKTHKDYVLGAEDATEAGYSAKDLKTSFDAADSVLVDYYTEHGVDSGAKQIEITPDKFGGNYYLEASTLFRDTNGVDMPAEFIIPNCKIQSNFTFSMASTGDPSTFTFTLDAFPDYTRFDHSKKVLAAIQIIETLGSDEEVHRTSTGHDAAHDLLD
jgi:hypothetical protein